MPVTTFQTFGITIFRVMISVVRIAVELVQPRFQYAFALQFFIVVPLVTTAGFGEFTECSRAVEAVLRWLRHIRF